MTNFSPISVRLPEQILKNIFAITLREFQPGLKKPHIIALKFQPGLNSELGYGHLLRVRENKMAASRFQWNKGDTIQILIGCLANFK